MGPYEDPVEEYMKMLFPAAAFAVGLGVAVRSDGAGPGHSRYRAKSGSFDGQ